MVQIPQYTRDQLVSPVVGTPGIDMSGAESAKALSGAFESAANTAFDIAIKQQQDKDTAEANNLMTQYKISTINSLGQHQKTYASTPDSSGPIFHQEMQDNLQATAKLASNDRVKNMVQKGDPYFDGHMVMEQGKWAAMQEQHNVFNNAKTVIDDLGHKASAIGENADLTYQQKMDQLSSLSSALGSTVASIKSSRRPDLADQVTLKGLQSMMRGVYGGTLNSNPAAALAMLNEKQFKEVFNEKQLGEMAKGADAAMKSFAAKVQWKTVSKDLIDHPTLVSDILVGKMTWMDVDNLQKQAVSDPSPMQAQTFDYLKKLSLSTSPTESVAEQSSVHDKLLTDAHQINVDVPKKTPTENVDALMKFSNELIDAKVRGAISPTEFAKMHKQIVSPLTASVIKKFDPQGFDALTANMGSWWNKTWGHKDPQTATDRFSQGFETIDNYLRATGADKQVSYHDTKRALMTEYLSVMDGKIGNPNARTPQGTIYTAADVAHEVMGVAMGNMVKTPLGMRKVNGYTAAGIPTVETTKEDDELLKGPLGKMSKKKAP